MIKRSKIYIYIYLIDCCLFIYSCFCFIGPDDTAPVITNISPEKLSKNSGETVKLEAKISAHPKPEVQWLKDNTKVQESERIKCQQERELYSLTISDASCKDDGKYVCSATNNSGSASSGFELEVNEPPKILKELDSVVVKKGENAKFTVEISGKPVPELKWFLNGEAIEENAHARFEKEEETCVMIIDTCSVEDAGKVKCVAINTAGEVSSQGSLDVEIVETLPVIMEEPELERNVKEGDEAVFDLKVKTSNAEITW